MKKAFRYDSPVLPLNLICFLFMLASFGFRVYRALLPHADITVGSVLFFYCFPLIASLLFAILTVSRIHSPHLTAWPYTFMAVGCIREAAAWDTPYMISGIVTIAVLWILYILTVLGRISFRLPLAFLHLPVSGLLFAAFFDSSRAFPVRIETLSLVCFAVGVTFYLFSLKKITLERAFRRFGDRVDGRLLRSRPPMDNIASYFMPDRIGAANQFRDELDIAKIEKYILQKRKEGYKNYGLMHVLVAAYVRTIAEHPAINRFISGQKLYTRDDLIEINMTIKKEMRETAPETAVKFTLRPTMTAGEVYRVLQSEILSNKNDILDADMDRTSAVLAYIPGVLLKFFVWILKLLDYLGLLPSFLLKVSPFHGSLYITSMGSLGIPPVQHHLYSFGNVPVFLAFGPKKRRYDLDSDGKPVEKRYCEFTVTCDDRICDGFTYAAAFKCFRRYVANPTLLDTPPEKVIRDVD